jgi:hypothetical protein
VKTVKLLRQLQYEVSQLNRKLHSFEQESKTWSLRYSRRLVILSNLLLAFWLFMAKFLASIRHRERASGLLARILMPRIDRKSNALLMFVASAFIAGLKSCWVFCLSAYLVTSRPNWRRNVGCSLSTLYSIYLAFVPQFMPWSNYVNVFLNVTHLFARYFQLHGLPAFDHLTFL